MYPKVTKVLPEDNFILLLEFNNSEIRMFDLKPFLEFGLFSELKNIELFKTVRVSFDTIEWDNQADLDPEFLYSNSLVVEKNIILHK